MTTTYPIQTSASEFDRLRAQTALFRGDTQRLLSSPALQPLARCLDLCCGIGGIVDLLARQAGGTAEVVGLDADEEKLRVAREWARSLGLANVRFVAGDAFATGLAAHTFDLVHTRFALSVIARGEKMLDHALELVRPGGHVFLEEVDFGSCSCEPAHPAWDRAVAAIESCFEAVGADLFLGTRLDALLREAGVDVTVTRRCNHALRAGEPMQHHVPWTLDTMRESILGLGLLDAPTLEGTVRELHDHLAHPGTRTRSFTMVQVVGRTPDG